METTNQKTYSQTWYENNRDKHLEYYRELIRCDVCNCMIVRSALTNHQRTKKHTNNLKK